MDGIVLRCVRQLLELNKDSKVVKSIRVTKSTKSNKFSIKFKRK